jgi:broad specificity phosphatase PhoE
MKPNRIILIRHGESEGNVDKNIYGQKPDYALELTDRGLEQAREAGLKLREIVGEESVQFYISPYWRTRSTFEQVASQLRTEQFRFTEEPRIREQEWGHLREYEIGKQIEQQRDRYGVFYYRLPDGESAADVFDRVSDFFGTLHRDFEKPHYPQNTVIVTHGMAIRLFLMRWYHWTVEEFELLANPVNCELFVLEKENNGKYAIQHPIRRYDSVDHPYQRPVRLSG